MTYIKASTDFISRLGALLLFLQLTIVGSAPLLLLSFYIFLRTPDMRPPIWLVLICIFLGILFGKYCFSHFGMIMDAVLSENELTIGLLFKKKYLLNHVEKIVMGVPVCRHDFFGRRGEIHTHIICSNTLFIKFINGSFLTLNIHHLKNGTKLMEELTKGLDHIIDKTYVYNDKEKKLLRKYHVNSYVRQ